MKTTTIPNVGETVYDSRPLRGKGTVVSRDDHSFRVQFSTGQEELYTPGLADARATWLHLTDES